MCNENEIENKTELSLLDYYKLLSETQTKIREEICNRIGFTTKTFYNKLNDNSWTPLELEAVNQIFAENLTKIKESI